MCGFTGFLGLQSQLERREALPILERMANTIINRGPDDAGYWFDSAGDAAIGLAHRRLSILDLSPAGHQPMACHTGRYVLAFNGEIYNHLDLRRDLQAAGHAPVWLSHSDTETLLAGFVAWGVRATLERCIGMFAIALWDRREQLLTLARDRLGEKPLYYGWQGQGSGASFLFGSELKALKAHPAFAADIDRNALALLMRHNCIAAPHSIYQGIHKLLPGHLLTVSLPRRQPVLECYWSLRAVAEAGIESPFAGTDVEAVDELETMLRSAVGQQMVADVPLGAFLSGGIDSSTVVALMQAQSSRPVKTFTIGFSEVGYNEAIHAQTVARHLGTDHTELYVRPEDALAVIPRLSHIYCEPFADSSQIPTFLVSQLARQHVTVALSGDAGDELFGGYNPYQFAPRIWQRINTLPVSWRKLAARALSGLPVPERLGKLADVLGASSREDFYRRLVSHWKHPEQLVVGAHEPATVLNTPAAWPATDCFEHWMMAMDAQSYMTDDILVKVDRAAMANSLETRVPMLDHRVVELAWRMPLNLKIRDGKGKWLLREVLYRHVPRELIERPKKGFSIPLASWLRGPLREWAEDLLDAHRLHQEGYLESAPIRRKWLEHLSGRRDHSGLLWSVLMFQSWLGARA